MSTSRVLRSASSLVSGAREATTRCVCLRCHRPVVGVAASRPSFHRSTSSLSRHAAKPLSSSPLRRPTPIPQRALVPGGVGVPSGTRSIFIQTESTPNPDALKFLPNQRVLPPNISTPFIEYLTPRSTLAPPYPSPLAAQLLAVDGVVAVFYGTDFITVTKDADARWQHVRPQVFALITEAVSRGEPLVNVVETRAATGSGKDDRKDGTPLDTTGESEQATAEQDSLSYDENDSEVVGMIKELLETRIRPAIQEDGGDIEFRGFQDGYVMLKLRGACRTCDSSTVTLKNGIEGMLMHYVSPDSSYNVTNFLEFLIFFFSFFPLFFPTADSIFTLQIEEVKGVHQVMDQEEKIAMKEFAKFEEKLKAQKAAVSPSTDAKDSLDSVPG